MRWHTRFKLAECQTEAAVARAYVDNCVVRAVDGDLDKAGAAMDRCLQMHGGNGFMVEYPIARMYTNVRVGPI